MISKWFSIIITLLLSLAFFTQNTYAQSTIHAGFQLGIVSSKLTGKNTELLPSEGKLSLSHGLIMEIMFNSRFSLITEFSIFNKGAYILPNITNNKKQEISLQYFEIPVLFKYNLPFTVDNASPYVTIGGSFAFNTRNRYSEVINGHTILYDKTEWQNQDKNLIIGIGFQVNPWFFNIRSHMGFSKIPFNIPDLELTNQIILFQVGYLFQNK